MAVLSCRVCKGEVVGGGGAQGVLVQGAQAQCLVDRGIKHLCAQGQALVASHTLALAALSLGLSSGSRRHYTNLWLSACPLDLAFLALGLSSGSGWSPH